MRRFPCQPQREIDRISMRVLQRLLLRLHPVAWRLVHEARTTEPRVPVVVGKMMKRALRDSRSSVAGRLKGNGKIEALARDLAIASRDHAGRFVAGCIDSAFVRVRGQIANCARR